MAKVEDPGRAGALTGGQQAKVGGGGQSGQALRQSVQLSAPAGTAEVDATGVCDAIDREVTDGVVSRRRHFGRACRFVRVADRAL